MLYVASMLSDDLGIGGMNIGVYPPPDVGGRSKAQVGSGVWAIFVTEKLDIAYPRAAIGKFVWDVLIHDHVLVMRPVVIDITVIALRLGPASPERQHEFQGLAGVAAVRHEIGERLSVVFLERGVSFRVLRQLPQ